MWAHTITVWHSSVTLHSDDLHLQYEMSEDTLAFFLIIAAAITDNPKQALLHVYTWTASYLCMLTLKAWQIPFLEVAVGQTAGCEHHFSFLAEANDYSEPWTVALGSSGIQDCLTLTRYRFAGDEPQRLLEADHSHESTENGSTRRLEMRNGGEARLESK